MGRKKLLSKLAEFFNLDARAKEQQKEDLHILLKRLKKKEVKLKDELERETDEELKVKLAQKIDVVHSQRKKGVKMCKNMRNEALDKAS